MSKCSCTGWKPWAQCLFFVQPVSTLVLKTPEGFRKSNSTSCPCFWFNSSPQLLLSSVKLLREQFLALSLSCISVMDLSVSVLKSSSKIYVKWCMVAAPLSLFIRRCFSVVLMENRSFLMSLEQQLLDECSSPGLFLPSLHRTASKRKLCEGRDTPGSFMLSYPQVSSLVPAYWKHSVIFIECLHECETSRSFLFLQD